MRSITLPIASGNTNPSTVFHFLELYLNVLGLHAYTFLYVSLFLQYRMLRCSKKMMTNYSRKDKAKNEFAKDV